MGAFFRSSFWEAAELFLAVIAGPALVLHAVWFRERITLVEGVALLCFLGLGVRALEGRRAWVRGVWAVLCVAAIAGATVQWGRVTRELPWLRDAVTASIGW
ncbi:hypothetical protein [Mangrovicoccus sp. HB161399]|uniref:hypothetical protein n=1 Tax=Mangrovicoccus sp. HB161399 TaxID=2720392 RepID=UPI001554F0BA|nr:hypothetical protein [Mangrovicoccus sp. HB161399]